MDKYYFKLVCVDEQNPIGYCVLEDQNLDNLEDVHKYVEKHINNHHLGTVKWVNTNDKTECCDRIRQEKDLQS